MNKLILATLASVALASGSAAAADIPTKAPILKAPPPPAATWTGCYLDAGVGYGMYTQTSHSETDPGLVPIGAQITNGGQGWLGRLGGGCDYQFPVSGLGNFVVGVLADYDFMNLRGTYSDPSGPVQGPEKERGAWYVGGRLGYLVTPSLLAYASAGYTETRFDQLDFFTPLAAPVSTGLDVVAQTYHGWFLGGGTEYALNMSWIPIHGLFWRTEYRYASYDAADVPIVVAATGAPFGVAEHMQKDVQTITSSLVWRFNWGGPVTARY
jgi:outer membrane immunogenic protein